MWVSVLSREINNRGRRWEEASRERKKGKEKEKEKKKEKDLMN